MCAPLWCGQDDLYDEAFPSDTKTRSKVEALRARDLLRLDGDPDRFDPEQRQRDATNDHVVREKPSDAPIASVHLRRLDAWLRAHPAATGATDADAYLSALDEAIKMLTPDADPSAVCARSDGAARAHPLAYTATCCPAHLGIWSDTLLSTFYRCVRQWMASASNASQRLRHLVQPSSTSSARSRPILAIWSSSGSAQRRRGGRPPTSLSEPSPVALRRAWLPLGALRHERRPSRPGTPRHAWQRARPRLVVPVVRLRGGGRTARLRLAAQRRKQPRPSVRRLGARRG